MTTSPWQPPGKIEEAEQQLAAVEPVYRQLVRTLHHLARDGEAVPAEAAIVALVDLAADLMVASGLLWRPDVIANLRAFVDGLDQRRTREPAPPLVEDLRDALKIPAGPQLMD
jgi:hypothetical protein